MNMLPATRWVSFDCETTGFRSDARVIEIGCALFENGAPVQEWSSLVRPIGIDWTTQDVVDALATNGLKPEQFEGQPTFAELFPKLFTILRSARVWVAHSARFDLRMLDAEFRRYKGSDFPIKAQEGVLCTLALSRALHPRIKGHKLGEVATRWNIPMLQAHRASSDALTCGRILAAMSVGELPPDVGWVHDTQQGRQVSDGGSLWG